MRNRGLIFLLASALGLSMFAGCDMNTTPDVNSEEEEETITEGSEDTVADAEAENSEDHEDATDYIWDSSTAIPIILKEFLETNYPRGRAKAPRNSLD